MAMPDMQVKELAMLGGSFPALVTPFRDEAFDEARFRALSSGRLAKGSHGLVPCGTTGEAATLDFGGALAGGRGLRRAGRRAGDGDRRLRLERTAHAAR
jgi:hypothetical protein